MPYWLYFFPKNSGNIMQVRKIRWQNFGNNFLKSSILSLTFKKWPCSHILRKVWVMMEKKCVEASMQSWIFTIQLGTTISQETEKLFVCYGICSFRDGLFLHNWDKESLHWTKGIYYVIKVPMKSLKNSTEIIKNINNKRGPCYLGLLVMLFRVSP